MRKAKDFIIKRLPRSLFSYMPFGMFQYLSPTIKLPVCHVRMQVDAKG
jgi:hypothetical protein